MGQTIRGKVSSGLFWSFGERILAQGISFVVSIVLARLLMPEEYGIISIVLVFINISNVFVSNGFGESLIQKKNATKEDFSTIFCCSFFTSIVLYSLLFIVAPLIGKFYDSSQLVWVIRVLAVKLPLASINTIQHAYVSKHMQFKKFFFSTLAGTLVSGCVGIALAFRGLGVWALVAQYLINSTMDTIVLLFTIEWRPSFRFKMSSAKELMGFGFKMMLSSLINTSYSEAQSLVIGKAYSPNDLAYYKRGGQFPSLFITNICTAVSTVLFPTMANATNSISEVKAVTKRSLQMTAYIITPLMIGMMAVAKPLILVLLTDKWSPCIIYMQLLCLAYMLQPIQAANCQAIKAIGRSDVYLKMEVAKKIIGILLLLLALPHGVMAITIAFVLSVFCSSIITMIPNINLLGYSIKEQVFDLLPSFVLSAIMFAIIYPLIYIKLSNIILLIIQVFLGGVVYFGGSFIIKEKSFIYLLDFAKGEKK